MPSSPIVASAEARPRRSRGLYAVLALLVLGFVAYPYVTLYRLGQALDRGDTATLDRLIDWDAVRGQFRDDMLARTSAGLPREEGQRGDVSVIIIAHNYGQVLEVCDRVNLLQGGQITLDKRSSETSVAELTEQVVAEYRKAREERHRSRSA